MDSITIDNFSMKRRLTLLEMENDQLKRELEEDRCRTGIPDYTVCKNQLSSAPLLLPCGHSICTNCVQPFGNSSRGQFCHSASAVEGVKKERNVAAFESFELKKMVAALHAENERLRAEAKETHRTGGIPECPICRVPYTEAPHMTACGHSICTHCLPEFLDSPHRDFTCRKPINRGSFIKNFYIIIDKHLIL